MCSDFLENILSPNYVPQKFQHQQHQHRQHHRTYESRALRQRAVSAEVVARDAAERRGQRHAVYYRSSEGEGHQRGVVGGEVQYLRVSRGGSKVEAHEDGEGHDREGPRPRAEEAVVPADQQSDHKGEQRGVAALHSGGAVRLAEVPFKKNYHRRAGQDDNEHRLYHLVAEQQRRLRADGGADERAERRDRRRAQVDRAVPPELEDREGGAAGAGELIASQRKVRRHAGEDISRQGDYPAAARRGVDKSREKHQKAH